MAAGPCPLFEIGLKAVSTIFSGRGGGAVTNLAFNLQGQGFAEKGYSGASLVVGGAPFCHWGLGWGWGPGQASSLLHWESPGAAGPPHSGIQFPRRVPSRPSAPAKTKLPNCLLIWGCRSAGVGAELLRGDNIFSFE